MMTSLLRLLVAVGVVFSILWTTGAEARRTPFPPRTLIDLVGAADFVFVGRLETITPKPKNHTLNLVFTTDLATGVLGNRTVFDPNRLLQISGSTLMLEQSYADIPAIEPGDTHLWFGTKEHKTGALRPIPFTGVFRVQKDPAGRLVAANLLGNRGLWGNSLFTERLTEKTMRDFLKSQHDVPEARREEIMTIASNPCTPNPVPLELILATVKLTSNAY